MIDDNLKKCFEINGVAFIAGLLINAEDFFFALIDFDELGVEKQIDKATQEHYLKNRKKEDNQLEAKEKIVS